MRAPLVITFAAAASALGCGASVSVYPPVPVGDASTSGDAGTPGDTSPTTDRTTLDDRGGVMETDVRRGCPATLPSDGAACTPGVDRATCTDTAVATPGCPPGTGATAYCNPETGRWQRIMVSCNPPPPVRCPEMRPLAGVPCPGGSYIGGAPLRCGYERCAGIYVVQATCSGPTARWSVQEGSCNPPPLVDAGSGVTDS